MVKEESSEDVQGRNQQLPPGSGVGIKIEINVAELTPSVPQGSLIDIPGSDEAWNPPQPQRQPLNQVARNNQQSQSSVNNIYQQNGRKRKQPVSSSEPSNSSGTANTAGPSPRSAPSSHTPGDAISMANLPHSGGSSYEDGDQQDAVGRCIDVSKGFTFSEVYSVHASTGKVICCDFSSDGKLIASAGHDKKVVLWYTDTMKPKTTLEGHTAMITDVRFSPSLPRLATSSFDKTVRVWDVDNEGSSLRTFMGHSSMVTSLDFHPNKDDLICSCEEDGEIRFWSINNGSCIRVYKGSSTQMSFQRRKGKYIAPSVSLLRFQPRVGKYLAASSANVVSVLDVETQACLHSLQGHSTPINSVCWDPSGDFLATVSADMVKVWTLGTGSEGECVYELSCNGSKFMSCVFHPSYPSLLVVGCYQSLELWNMSENKTMTLPAHEALIASLAVSTATGLVASASHDKLVKLWK